MPVAPCSKIDNLKDKCQQPGPAASFGRYVPQKWKQKLNSLTLDKLIEEYKKMASICYQINYNDMQSVRSNNDAVDRMYEIVDRLKSDFGIEGQDSFKQLLDMEENRTDLWAAVHILEKMNVDIETEKKALKIIEEEAKESMGMNYWLKEWKEKGKGGT